MIRTLSKIITCCMLTAVSIAATSQPVLEVVIFTTKPNVNAKHVQQLAQQITPILAHYPGFIARHFGEDSKRANRWIDVVTWATLNDALAAAKHVVTQQPMQAFVNTMQNYQMYHVNLSINTRLAHPH